MTAAILSARTNNPQGRPSAAVLAERLERSRLRNLLLAEEIRALTAERSRDADEIEALARRMELAFHADRPDVALHCAGRLEALAHSMARKGAA